MESSRCCAYYITEQNIASTENIRRHRGGLHSHCNFILLVYGSAHIRVGLRRRSINLRLNLCNSLVHAPSRICADHWVKHKLIKSTENDEKWDYWAFNWFVLGLIVQHIFWEGAAPLNYTNSGANCRALSPTRMWVWLTNSP